MSGRRGSRCTKFFYFQELLYFIQPVRTSFVSQVQPTAANQFGILLGAFNVKQYSTILSRILHESFMHQDNQIWKVIIVINYGTSLIILL